MARIRTIKPEFFTSANIVELTPLARLFYVSLWCESDREGRLNWNPKTLKYRYLPADDVDINTLKDELEKSGLIIIYKVDGREYAEIPSFKSHQVINNRESESLLPPRVKDASSTRESGVQGEGKEGREGKGTRVTGTRFIPPTLEEVKAYCKTRKNNVDPDDFINHYEANGWMRGKTKIKDWKACVHTWEKKTKRDDNWIANVMAGGK